MAQQSINNPLPSPAHPRVITLRQRSCSPHLEKLWIEQKLQEVQHYLNFNIIENLLCAKHVLSVSSFQLHSNPVHTDMNVSPQRLRWRDFCRAVQLGNASKVGIWTPHSFGFPAILFLLIINKNTMLPVNMLTHIDESKIFRRHRTEITEGN